MELEETWRGETVISGSVNAILLGKGHRFRLHVRKLLFGRFTGTVQEEGELAIPGSGYVEGQCRWGRITFSIQMPVFYTFLDGQWMPLSEAVPLHYGTTLREELVHPNLHYEGQWENATNHFRGIWHVEPVYVSFADGRRRLFGGTEGTWHMAKIPGDDLVRASAEPVQEQQRVLLRAAVNTETPAEQLVRTVHGPE